MHSNGPHWIEFKSGPGPSWEPNKSKETKFSKSKSVLHKMSARSGLVGKNHPDPICGHLRQFFPWTGNMQKHVQNLSIFLGGPMGNNQNNSQTNFLNVCESVASPVKKSKSNSRREATTSIYVVFFRIELCRVSFQAVSRIWNHWPTKENRQNISIFFDFPGLWTKMASGGPKQGREDSFPTNPDLADILGRTDFDFENFYFLDFLGSQLGPGPDLKNLARLSAPRIPAGG